MTQRPSGWYDDPRDETQLRYFDGIMWSDRTMPKLRPGLEHVGEARPESERASMEPSTGATHRRDGEPRTYPAHWGPEEPQHQHPFAPPTATVHHDRAPFGDRTGQVAGLGSRLVAHLIDRLVLGLVLTVGFLIFAPDTVHMLQDWFDQIMDAARSGATSSPDMPGPLQTAMFVLVLTTAAVGVLYDTLMTSMCRGRTLGRMVMKIAVVPAGTQGAAVREAKVKPQVAFLRSAIKWGPEAIGTFGEIAQLVIFFSALSNRQRAGLHDRAARTEVRRLR